MAEMSFELFKWLRDIGALKSDAVTSTDVKKGVVNLRPAVRQELLSGALVMRVVHCCCRWYHHDHTCSLMAEKGPGQDASQRWSEALDVMTREHGITEPEEEEEGLDERAMVGVLDSARAALRGKAPKEVKTWFRPKVTTPPLRASEDLFLLRKPPGETSGGAWRRKPLRLPPMREGVVETSPHARSLVVDGTPGAPYTPPGFDVPPTPIPTARVSRETILERVVVTRRQLNKLSETVRSESWTADAIASAIVGMQVELAQLHFELAAAEFKFPENGTSRFQKRRPYNKSDVKAIIMVQGLKRGRDLRALVHVMRPYLMHNRKYRIRKSFRSGDKLMWITRCQAFCRGIVTRHNLVKHKAALLYRISLNNWVGETGNALRNMQRRLRQITSSWLAIYLWQKRKAFLVVQYGGLVLPQVITVQSAFRRHLGVVALRAAQLRIKLAVRLNDFDDASIAALVRVQALQRGRVARKENYIPEWNPSKHFSEEDVIQIKIIQRHARMVIARAIVKRVKSLNAKERLRLRLQQYENPAFLKKINVVQNVFRIKAAKRRAQRIKKELGPRVYGGKVYSLKNIRAIMKIQLIFRKKFEVIAKQRAAVAAAAAAKNPPKKPGAKPGKAVAPAASPAKGAKKAPETKQPTPPGPTPRVEESDAPTPPDPAPAAKAAAAKPAAAAAKGPAKAAGKTVAVPPKGAETTPPESAPETPKASEPAPAAKQGLTQGPAKPAAAAPKKPAKK